MNKYTLLFLFLLSQVYAADKADIALLNAGERKMIHSGFLLGTVNGSNISHVELKLDDHDYVRLEDHVLWKYKLPAGNETWQNGEKHSIKVRVTFKNQKTQIKEFNLVKGNNRDLNGDGFPDLVMGDHLYDRNRGAAYIYLGEEQGIQTTGKPAEIIPGSKNESYFGKTLVIEDVNRDGFADVVISSFDANSRVKAYIYKGSETVLGKPYINTVVNDLDKAGYFGISFGIENVTKPGFMDLIIQSRKKKEVRTIKVK